MPKKYKEGIYMGVAPTTHMHATNVTLNDGTSVQADSDAIHDYLNRKFELIEDITLTEDTALIERSTEPDNTPYNFSDVLIQIFATTGTANGNTNITINDDAPPIGYISGSVNNSGDRYSYVLIYNHHGLVTAISKIGAASPYHNSNFNGYGKIIFNTPITKISIANTADLPTDSVIKIYAVRT